MTEPGPARKSGCGRIPDQGSTTRSSRWTTSCGQPVGRGRRSGGRRRRAARAAEYRTRPFANGTPRAVDDLDRVVGVERALDAADPGRRAASGCPDTSARRAPSSTTTRPPAPGANAIQSLRLGSRSARGGRPCRPPARRPRRATTPGASAAAITARTPDHAAIFAAASLLAIPPLPRVGARAAGDAPRARRRPRRSPRSATPRRRGADRR